MRREARLQSAQHWLAGFEGKNVVRSYRKRYAVDLECALIELDMLGVGIDPSYAQELRASEEARLENRRRRAESKTVHQDEDLEPGVESDGVFGFIAGYTSGGTPYGLTWDELEDQHLEEEPPAEQDPREV